MLLIITRDDDSEESYDVSARTKLRSALRGDHTWFFVTTEGGQIAFDAQEVKKITLGNVGAVASGEN